MRWRGRSKGCRRSGFGRGVRDHPQPAARACGRRAGHRASAGHGRADRPGAVAQTGSGVAMLVAAVIAPDSKLATARGLRTETATSSLGQVLGVSGCDEDDLYAAMDWALARKDASKTPWPHGIWPMGRWCSMTCPRRRSRAAPARWGRSGMPATGSKAGARSSTGCCAPPPGYRWPSRCSTATPPTPRR